MLVAHVHGNDFCHHTDRSTPVYTESTNCKGQARSRKGFLFNVLW